MLALDILLLVLISTCIVYCWILNQRIRDLHNSRVEFARMIKEFDAAVIKASNCISELSSLSSSTSLEIKNLTMDAQEISADLKIINDLGNNISNKLEKYITESRNYSEELSILIENASMVTASAASGKKKSPAAAKKATKSVKATTTLKKDVASEEQLDAEAELLPEHKNLLETVLAKISTHKHKGTLDQSGFYNSLRKVSVK